MVLFVELLYLFLKGFLHFDFAVVQVVVLVPRLQLRGRKLVSQFFDPLLLRRGAHLLVDTTVPGILLIFKVRNQLGFNTFEISDFLLLSKDLLTVRNHGASISLFNQPASRVLVFDVEHHQRAIFASREEEVVVVGDAHAFDTTRAVDLHFVDLV